MLPSSVSPLFRTSHCTRPEDAVLDENAYPTPSRLFAQASALLAASRNSAPVGSNPLQCRTPMETDLPVATSDDGDSSSM